MKETTTEHKIKYLLGKYYIRTFERVINYLEENHKEMIQADAQLTKGLSKVKQLNKDVLPNLELVYLYGSLKELGKGKKKKRLPAFLLCMLLEIHLDHFEGLEDTTGYLLKKKLPDEGLHKCIVLLFHIMVVHYSNADELEENFIELCRNAPEDFQLAPILWHLSEEDVSYDVLMTLARLADAKMPFNQGVLGFKAFMYRMTDKILESLYTHTVLLYLIQTTKKGERNLGITYFLMARDFYDVQNIPMAIDYCNKGIQAEEKKEQTDNLEMMYYLRAEALVKQGEADSAKADIERILKIDPVNEDAKELLEKVENME